MNNPEAFPRACGQYTDSSGSRTYDVGTSGMTLLDYLAGQALIGLCTRYDENEETLAIWSYTQAEKMLEQREKTLVEIKHKNEKTRKTI